MKPRPKAKFSRFKFASDEKWYAEWTKARNFLNLKYEKIAKYARKIRHGLKNAQFWGLKTWGCLPPPDLRLGDHCRPVHTCSFGGLLPPPATSGGGNRNWSTHGFQAGDMHPAGMQSCFYTFVVFTVLASRVHWHHPLSRTRVDTSRFIIMLFVLPSVGKHL